MSMACPGCAGVPDAPDTALAADGLVLSVPRMHCATCISAVERALAAYPGVQQARVNLTLKRALVRARPEVTAAALIGTLAEAGFEAFEMDSGQLRAGMADTEGRALLLRLGVAGFAMMNVMLLSVAVWSGASDATRDMFHWISAAITLPALAFTGQPFYRNAARALAARRLNMDVPITLAILLAVVMSLWETMLSGKHAYFDAAIALVFFLLIGRYLDHRARAAARGAALSLAALEVHRAVRREGDDWVEVAAAALSPGDVIRVLPGSRMPADGTVIRGVSEADRSALTGESLPVSVAPGSAVSTGEVNLSGPLELRVSAAGPNTALARMVELVGVAESGRANYSPLADRAASLYAPGVHILAALAAIGWFIATGELRIALNIAAAVLIITCPCALGLAVPAVTTAASGRLFRKGLLIKEATALERLAEADLVVFDKTGTLTLGLPEAGSLDHLSAEHRPVARALAEASVHPFAQSLARRLQSEGVMAAEISDVIEHPGLGVAARWQGCEVRLGRAGFTGGATDGAGSGGVSYLRVGANPPAAITFTDRARPGAIEAVRGLSQLGLEVMILSGDRPAPVAELAATLGVTDWQAELLPEDKHAVIAACQAAGRRVLMVGDGLNDTAALAAAHVSIAPASALDAARSASDMVLLGSDLSVLPDALRTARQSVRRIKENFALATVYNVIAVPLAMAGMVTPLIAALAMSASSITVALNALRLGAPDRRGIRTRAIWRQREV